MNLDEIRNNINEIDNELLDLLRKRRDFSKEVILNKDKNKSILRDKGRESEILKRLIIEGEKLGLDSNFISKLFHVVIEDSVRIQQKHLQGFEYLNKSDSKKTIKIAIQGIDGSYSSLASRKYFNQLNYSLEFICKNTFDEVILAVENGEADYSVLPCENTTSGSINEVYDLLLHTTLSIIGEEVYHVEHCLVGTNESKLNEVKRIYSHEQGAKQCSKFLSSLSDCTFEYYTDTAMSVRKIKEENNPVHAAIASKESAELFGVKILKENIANQTGNFTRFIISSRKAVENDARIGCKTSIVMATNHAAGSLVEALLVFQNHKINLTKLESRPILGNPWEEMFYIDFEGNTGNENVQLMLDELGHHTKFIKVLGCYPLQEIEKTEIATQINSEIIKEEIDDEVYEKKPLKKVSYKYASREYKAEDTIINVKGVQIGGDKFTVIAGPCSVESEDQILQCANEVKNNGANILRGGCYKPRTSPYSFQGMGNEGLDLLNKAGNYYDLPIITEVLAISQLADVVKSADIIQIGARNMQNFSLLKEVGKVHKPVMLKRGLMSSIDELLNAAEYILAQGNRQVILCERGIRTFETATRNTLDLSAIPVLKELTHLPIIVDPSHAVGERDKVIPLAKASKVVGAHGIMIEFHPDPEKALSDGDQSLRFDQFKNLMVDLNKL